MNHRSRFGAALAVVAAATALNAPAAHAAVTCNGLAVTVNYNLGQFGTTSGDDVVQE